MKKLPLIALAAFGFATAAPAQQPYAPPPPREISFDDDWRFHLGDVPDAQKHDFDDSAWRKLDLPHDYAIEGAFDPHSPAGGGGGYLAAGAAWYRKTFTIPETESGLAHIILFDGVYMDCEVYLNGYPIGGHPYGYTGFYFDLGEHLHTSGDLSPNVLAVRVNVRQPSSRWYSGAGIYRHVHLITCDRVHIEPWNFTVTTPKVEPDLATVVLTTGYVAGFSDWIYDLSTPAFKQPAKPPELKVASTIIDPDGTEIAKGTVTWQQPPDSAIEQTTPPPTQTLYVHNPRLWSPDTPVLYRAKAEVLLDGKVVDTVETTFGIRTIQFTPDRGLLLNGKPLPIRGVCDHHDLGCLGAAAYRRGIERQLEILKTIGVNAIRTSHNPPSPELLDLCDSMGFVVMDEAFDEWKEGKTQFGYARFFDDWSERDLQSMVRRDRNHPSVILWSIGNEIPEQHSANGAAMAKRLADIIRREDPTRPVTSACNEADNAIRTGYAKALDVLGINYHIDWYQKLKGPPMFASETASAISSRGVYNLLPGDDGKLHIKAQYSHQMSSYDAEAPGWATLVEPSLTSVRDAPWVAGQFVWTGFDYIGEPTPFGWPSRSSYFGIFDLCGFPKDRAYLYQSQWTDKPVVHLFPHWNWEGFEGKEIPVRCYTNADSVELFLNGKSLGVRDWKGNKSLHLEWSVPYTPGVLKAVGMKNGKPWAIDEIHTAGPPAKIELTSDNNSIATDGQDLAFITIRILDKDGNICPNSDNTVKLTLAGPGTIAGTDNGDATDITSFQSPARKAFHGLALAVIRAVASNEWLDEIVLTASSDGLAPATIKIGPKYLNLPDKGWLRK